MLQMKDINCCLCLVKSEEMLDVFGAEGMQLNMASILSLHYGFFQLQIVDKDENCAKMCSRCWTVTKEFNNFYLEVQQQWNRKSFKSDAIKMEVSIEPNDISLNFYEYETEATDKLVSGIQKLEDEIFQGENRNFSSDDSHTESSEPEYKPTRVKRTAKVYKKSSPKLPKKTTAIDHNQKKLNMDAENQTIREYFKMNCDVCNEHFENFLDIKTHFRQKHKSTGYLTCCGKRFFRRGGLLDHISRHVNPNKFKCLECNKLFSDTFSLKNHQENHLSMEMRPFKCNICPSAFTKQYKLSQHVRLTHTEDESKFECDDCGKIYPKKSTLRNHIKCVHEAACNIISICDICAKVFKSKQSLQTHRQQHFEQDQPKLQCTICGAWLKHELSLRKHVNRHKDVQMSCTLCGKITPNKTALSRHMGYVHSEATHKCGLCDKAFKREIGLKEHMALHTGEDLYTCPYCPKTFKSNANMHSHRKKGHPVEFKADRERRLNP